MTTTDHNKIDLLLFVLQAHSGLDALLRRGLEYHQIFQLIEQARALDLVTSNEKGYRLTTAGIERINVARRKFGNGGPDSWIVPEIESTIDQSDRWEVYLPPKSWMGRMRHGV